MLFVSMVERSSGCLDKSCGRQAVIVKASLSPQADQNDHTSNRGRRAYPFLVASAAPDAPLIASSHSLKNEHPRLFAEVLVFNRPSLSASLSARRTRAARREADDYGRGHKQDVSGWPPPARSSYEGRRTFLTEAGHALGSKSRIREGTSATTPEEVAEGEEHAEFSPHFHWDHRVEIAWARVRARSSLRLESLCGRATMCRGSPSALTQAESSRA